jgi:hypothetical protein
MASDFEISIERDRDCLRLDLSGDFDETSASSLIERLRNDCQEAAVVFIQARGLKNIHSSGRETFRRNLHVLEDFCYRLVFSDGNAAQIAPGWIEYF